MNWLRRKRMAQAIHYGWIDSKEISKETNKNKFSVFFDILSYFLKFNVFSSQYKANKMWSLPYEEKISICKTIGQNNKIRDLWIVDDYKSRKFIKKWSGKQWSTSPQRTNKRAFAYSKKFHTGNNFTIQYGVDIHREHFLDGKISIGNNVFISKNVSIDYSGDIIIEDDVKISESVIIESHSHNGYIDPSKVGTFAKKEELKIGKGSQIGVRATILESCHEIGRHARIGAGSVIRFNIPPYSIVTGNPGKIVGFSFSPSEMKEFEESHYPIEQRISVEEYEKIYKKYFSTKLKEIKNFTKRSI